MYKGWLHLLLSFIIFLRNIFGMRSFDNKEGGAKNRCDEP